MSDPAPRPARPADQRAAALAAAEARLRPAIDPASPIDASAGASVPEGSGISTPTRSGLFSGAASSSVKKWEPTEKEDRETRLMFSRLLDRGIVRDNGYKDAATCVETLLLIANNVIQHNEPKYRDLKSTNNMLRNKVLSAKGGHDYLIALGFRIATIDYTQHYVLQPSLKRMHELKIGADILSDHLEDLQNRAAQSASSKIYASADDAARKAKALREIEADRDSVKDRLARDKRMREREERIAREKAEKLKKLEEEKERMEMAGGMGGMNDAGTLGGMTVGGANVSVPAASMEMDEQVDWAATGEEEDANDEDEEAGSDEELMKDQASGGKRLGD